jgi:hypothetical protein
MGDLGQEPRLRDLLGWRGSREREWLARTWIIGEPRDQVRVQMRQGIAQCLVVHLERLIHGDDRAGDGEHLGPVARGLGVGKLGWLAHVTPPPDDDRVAALHVAALEVGIRVPALVNAHAEGVRLGPPLLAHRAANTSHQVGPVSRPLTHPRSLRSEARRPSSGYQADTSARLPREPLSGGAGRIRDQIRLRERRARAAAGFGGARSAAARYRGKLSTICAKDPPR